MKIAKFLLVLHAAEKGAAFVIKNHDSGEVTRVVPDIECETKIGGLCLQQKTKGHKKHHATAKEVTNQYDSSDSVPNGDSPLEIDPLVGYVLTKDKSYIDIALMADENLTTMNGNNPMLSIIAAKNADANPALAYALTKDPLMPLAADIAGDPALAVATSIANPRAIHPQNVLLSHLIKPQTAASTYALTGSPILAYAQGTGNKLPMYMALTGQDPSRAVGYIATEVGDPLLAQSLTGDRQAMYAAATNDPTLSYTAQQMNNPVYAYALTKDPILAMQQPKPDDGTAQPVNPMLAYFAAKQGDPSLALALTGDATTAYASTLPNAGTAALAASAFSDNPILTHYLAKDDVMTYDALSRANPNSPGMAYIAAKTGDPAMAMALTGNPATAYATQTGNPGLAAMAANQNSPFMAYYASKDPIMMALATDDEQLKRTAGVMSGNPQLAYAVTGDIGTYVAAEHESPIKAAIATQQGNPALTYVLTKDPKLTILSDPSLGLSQPAPRQPARAPRPDQYAPVGPAPLADTSGMIPAVAALSGNPMLAYAMTGDPATMYAATMDNPMHGILASQFNNPGMAYALTKDPVMTMLSSDQSGDNSGVLPIVAAQTKNPMLAYAMTGDPSTMYAATMDNPMHGVLASQFNNPGMTYALTKDPVMTMLTSDPSATQNNPGLGYIAASTGNPLMTYALTGNPALAMASQHADPLLAVTATHANNPAATYMLTKDPVLTMMTAMQGQQQPAGPPQPVNPVNTMIAGNLNNVTPGLAYGVTGDANMLLTGQWGNSNLALASTMANGIPTQQNPTMNLIAAHTMTDPNLSYALTGNALLANAVANGNGKDLVGLQLGQYMNNPLMTYALTKDPKMTYLSQSANPLLAYTALQTSPALAAIATQDPMMYLLARP